MRPRLALGASTEKCATPCLLVTTRTVPDATRSHTGCPSTAPTDSMMPHGRRSLTAVPSTQHRAPTGAFTFRSSSLARCTAAGHQLGFSSPSEVERSGPQTIRGNLRQATSATRFATSLTVWKRGDASVHGVRELVPDSFGDPKRVDKIVTTAHDYASLTHGEAALEQRTMGKKDLRDSRRAAHTC
jgi:hypothetical protein